MKTAALLAAPLIVTPAQAQWPPADTAVMAEIADHMQRYMPHVMFAIVLVDRNEPRTLALGPTTKGATTGPNRLVAQRLMYAARNYVNKLEAFLEQPETEMSETQLHHLIEEIDAKKV